MRLGSRISYAHCCLLPLVCLSLCMLAAPSGSAGTGAMLTTTAADGGGVTRAPFDLLKNNFGDGSKQFDVNGFLLNPQWSAQQYDPLNLPDPSDTDKCSRPDFSNCTDKDKPVIDKADLCTIFNCSIGTIAAGSSLWSRVPGHVNWKPATYTGKICFNDYSFDFDYTLNLMTKHQAGLTSLNPPNEKNDGEHPPLAMHTEFDARETVNNFVTDYWKNLVAKVGDRTHLKCADDPNADPCREINDKRAIEVGLVGLDTGHSGYSELHPVYALAVETDSAGDGSTSNWILFARNRGDEGDCSHLDHPLSCNGTKASDRLGILRLFIPVPRGKHASGARILDGTQFASNFGSGSNCPTFTFGHYGNDDGVLLELQLPPGKYCLPEDGPLVEGVLRIAWDIVGDAAASDWNDFLSLPDCATVPALEEEGTEPITEGLKQSANKTERKLPPIDNPSPLTHMSCGLTVLSPSNPNFDPPGLCEGRAINLKSTAIEDFHKRLADEIRAIKLQLGIPPAKK